MSWMIAIAAGSALMGANKAKRQEEMQKQNNLQQAEMTRYSPWTGVAGRPDNSYVPTMMEGAFAGGVQGAAMGQSLGAAGVGQADPGMSEWQKLQQGMQPAQQATFFGTGPSYRA